MPHPSSLHHHPPHTQRPFRTEIFIERCRLMPCRVDKYVHTQMSADRMEVLVIRLSISVNQLLGRLKCYFIPLRHLYPLRMYLIF